MLPLHGIKVVEIAQNLSGPYAGEILATLGADVLKVERPGGGGARGWGPPLIAGSATAFQTVNRNKRSITLDLRQSGGCSRLQPPAGAGRGRGCAPRGRPAAGTLLPLGLRRRGSDAA